MTEIPIEIRDEMKRAQRLEWWTLAGMGSVVVVMYFAMGGSQAMKTAFLEDLLGLVPAATFLIAAKLEPRRPTAKHPFGFVRVNSLAFLAAAVVLSAVGFWLLYDGMTALLRQERPSIGPVTLFGQTFWMGWLMIAALTYSVVIPTILGRLKKPLAEKLRDKVLHTDAQMQKADWQTGLAGILGLLGIAMGFWWADSAAAALISVSIIFDGLKNARTAAAELVDGAPRELAGSKISPEALRLHERLNALWPEAQIRIRESGRYMVANIRGIEVPASIPSLDELMGDDPHWRLAEINFTPPNCLQAEISN
jgi:cobalt-zinc-cadmium efflux system protein